MTARKVVQDEELSMQMLHSSTYNQVAKDGQYLISIKHPLLFLQPIQIIKLLNFLRNSLRTTHNRLQFINRRPRFNHLQQMIHTNPIRLRMLHNNISYLNILDTVIRITLLQLTNILLYRQPVKTKFIFDSKSLRTTAFQII